MSSILSPIMDSTSWYYYWGGAGKPANYVGPNPLPAGILDSVTQAWCGAAFDYATNTMHSCVAGGHTDSWSNQCFSIQIPSGSWSITRAQTTFPPDQHVTGYTPVNFQDGLATAGTGFYTKPDTTVTPVIPLFSRDGIETGAQVFFDGAPCSRHIYGGTVWMANKSQVLLLAGGGYGGVGDLYCGWFNPATGTWTRKTNLPVNTGGTGAVGTYDSLRGLVYWISGLQSVGNIRKYDPNTDTHTKLGPNTAVLNSSIGGQHTVLCCDGNCDYVYAIAKGGWKAQGYSAAPDKAIARMRLGQATQQPWELVTVTGDVTGMYGDCPGFEYDPDKNAFVFWSAQDPGNISVLRLMDFMVHRVPVQGSPPATTYTNPGVWGRFRRYGTHSYALFTGSRQPISLITLG